MLIFNDLCENGHLTLKVEEFLFSPFRTLGLPFQVYLEKNLGS
jgi:hypothetical protein